MSEGTEMKGDVQCIFDDFAKTAVFGVEFDDPDMKDNHEPTS
jgi:hypothetical protein